MACANARLCTEAARLLHGVRKRALVHRGSPPLSWRAQTRAYAACWRSRRRCGSMSRRRLRRDEGTRRAVAAVAAGNGGQGIASVAAGDGGQGVAAVAAGDRGQGVAAVAAGDGGQGVAAVAAGDGGQGVAAVAEGNGGEGDLAVAAGDGGEGVAAVAAGEGSGGARMLQMVGVATCYAVPCPMA
eukprot:364875-Chlamydomonas_euryale.AAC.6